MPGLIPGINCAGGKVTYQAVAEATGTEYVPVDKVLEIKI
jgi:alanine dehydrogenase